MRHADAVLSQLVRDIVAVEWAPAVAPERAQRSSQFAISRIQGSAPAVRMGAAAGALLVDGLARVSTRRSYLKLSAGRRHQFVRGLAATGVPIAADVVRLLRSLAALDLGTGTTS